MIGSKVLKSSEKQTWETPQDLFNKINDVYKFNLDCCAEDATAKVNNYFTVEDDALSKEWNGVVWCNPPYNREQIKFIEYARDQVDKGNAKTVVCLIPSRTDTKVWHNVIFKCATEVTFIKGRLRFGSSTDNAPFPSALVIFGESKGDLNLGKVVYLK